MSKETWLLLHSDCIFLKYFYTTNDNDDDDDAAADDDDYAKCDYFD